MLIPKARQRDQKHAGRFSKIARDSITLAVSRVNNSLEDEVLKWDEASGSCDIASRIASIRCASPHFLNHQIADIIIVFDPIHSEPKLKRTVIHASAQSVSSIEIPQKYGPKDSSSHTSWQKRS
jgi:hypothetical protein